MKNLKNVMAMRNELSLLVLFMCMCVFLGIWAGLFITVLPQCLLNKHCTAFLFFICLGCWLKALFKEIVSKLKKWKTLALRY